MIAASVLGLPAILLLLTVLPCIRMGHEPGVAKYRRAQLAGVLLILLGRLSLWPPTLVNVKELRPYSCYFKRNVKRSQEKPRICVPLDHIPEEFRQDPKLHL